MQYYRTVVGSTVVWTMVVAYLVNVADELHWDKSLYRAQHQHQSDLVLCQSF